METKTVFFVGCTFTARNSWKGGYFGGLGAKLPALGDFSTKITHF